jgi:Sec7-like guanine-nucleotide exchange factor
MEKFGLKFTSDNPEGTDGCQGEMTAECVYLLSYATMMMQTSLHNPNAAKSKMTLEDFSKMINGINAGQNLEPAFVKKIYETVERNPFTLNEDDDARIKQESANAHSEKRKKELLTKESQNIVMRS